jgi:toxin ParE1/3/4
MRIRWTPSAANDLENISKYLTANRPEFAHDTVVRLYEAALSLKSMPYRGRPGAHLTTRELIVPDLPYLIGYRVNEDAVEILRIRHGAQRPEI